LFSPFFVDATFFFEISSCSSLGGFLINLVHPSVPGIRLNFFLPGLHKSGRGSSPPNPFPPPSFGRPDVPSEGILPPDFCVRALVKNFSSFYGPILFSPKCCLFQFTWSVVPVFVPSLKSTHGLSFPSRFGKRRTSSGVPVSDILQQFLLRLFRPPCLPLCRRESFAPKLGPVCEAR